MKKDGFRITPEQRAANEQARKDRQASNRRVTHGELAQLAAQMSKLDDDLKKLAGQLTRFGAMTSNYTIRVEALAKTVFDSDILSVDAFRANFKGLTEVRQFVARLAAQPNLPMLEKVRQCVKFNVDRAKDFWITDAYFPNRSWLVANAEEQTGEQIIELCEGLGYTQPETEKILLDMIVAKELREEQVRGGGEVPDAPSRMGMTGGGMRG